jgi:lysozyme
MNGLVDLMRATLAGFFLFLLPTLAGCSTVESTVAKDRDGLPGPGDFAIHGIDVSKYQGLIDWQRVSSSGTQFAYIKATEGGDLMDEAFQRNWEAARAAGVKRGAYHFVYWCRPAHEQMAWFEQNVPIDTQALPPVLDVELTPDSKTCKHMPPREEALAQVTAMLAEMERHYGKRPVIYTTVDFYQRILQGTLTEYPTWVRSTKYYPSVKYGDRRWHFWQYQSDGSVAGIHSKVDRNAFFGSEKQWQAFLDGHPDVH